MASIDYGHGIPGSSPFLRRRPPQPPPPPKPRVDAVAEFLERNRDAFDKIIDHPFPRALGNGTASLDGFRYYMIQDKLRLEAFARLEMMGRRNLESIEHANKLKEICVTMLGIHESTLENTELNPELGLGDDFYESVSHYAPKTALFLYHITWLPRVLSHWKIAERLMEDPSTAKNVVYHPAWTVVNYDRSSVGKYIKFINENITDVNEEHPDLWNSIFQVSCEHQISLFNMGMQAPIPFQIIPDGTYSISLEDGDVLAIQNVEDSSFEPSDNHLGGYLPSDFGWSVVGVDETGGDNEKWIVVATEYGCTFQNLGTGHYLGISDELDQEEGKTSQAVFEPYYWWINPVSTYQEPQLYKVYDSDDLQNTLHANVEVLNSSWSTPIVVRENSRAPCQMWSFANCFEDLEDAKHTADQISQVLQTQIDQAERDEEAADNKNLQLIRYMCEKICHWAPFRGTFRSASFKVPPIVCGVVNGTSCFVTRSISQTTGPSGWIYEGASHGKDAEYEVLVGNMKGLTWVSCCGAFEIESLFSSIPVPLGNIDDPNLNHDFVARFPLLGNIYPGAVSRGYEASVQVERGGAPAKNTTRYDVLCYKLEVLLSH